MLHVIFEVNKVQFNDKTSQSSERGGSKDRQHINTESLTECVEGLVRLDYRDTKTHVSLYCTPVVRRVICKLMER